MTPWIRRCRSTLSSSVTELFPATDSNCPFLMRLITGRFGSRRTDTLTDVSPIRRAARRRQRTCPSMALDTSTLIIGALAAIISTGIFAPQAWKIIKTRERRTHPLACMATVAGFALWLAYGAMLGQWPLIATNSICFVLAAFILS
jgi:MtN3 and saliva related transmembrane protein